jgi:hypothetical protein
MSEDAKDATKPEYVAQRPPRKTNSTGINSLPLRTWRPFDFAQDRLGGRKSEALIESKWRKDDAIHDLD